MPREPSAKRDIEVLICAPLRNDASLLSAILRVDGYRVDTTTPAQAAEKLAHGDKVFVCTQDGLTRRLKSEISELIRGQPQWAQLPIIFLLDSDQNNAAVLAELNDLMVHGMVTILHRPIRPLELMTAISNAVTARGKQLELRDHLEYQNELQRELNHRVKNTLATFMAVYQMSLRQSDNLEEFSQKFTNRVSALSAVHDLLHSTRDGKRSLEDIVRAVTSPYIERRGARIRLEGRALDLKREHALSLALILNELTTNTVKHGSLSSGEGLVTISWDVKERSDGTEDLLLRWTESCGPRVTPPEKQGYGTRFMQTAIASLQGEIDLDYAEDGLRVEMVVPDIRL